VVERCCFLSLVLSFVTSEWIPNDKLRHEISLSRQSCASILLLYFVFVPCYVRYGALLSIYSFRIHFETVQAKGYKS